jgi:hypothetical protein
VFAIQDEIAHEIVKTLKIKLNVYMVSKKTDESKKRYVSPFLITFLYVGLDDKDKALSWLEKAYDQRNYRLVFLKSTPFLDGLRSDTKFIGLLKKMNFE